MELLLINEHKLKIMLTETDMQELGVSAQSLNYGDTATRKALWEIFDRAKHQTGFDAASDKIYIQVFAGAYGGCEMFVTKPAQMQCEDEVYFKIEKQKVYYRIYSFENLENLLSLCRVLSLRELSLESAVYSDGKIYYLVLSGKDSKFDMSEISLIDDYCTRREDTEKIYHITEHCFAVCPEDAIDVLAPLQR